jgi:hypothetical protein
MSRIWLDLAIHYGLTKDAIMSSTRWRNFAAVFMVAGGLVGLGMQKVATAQVATSPRKGCGSC